MVKPCKRLHSLHCLTEPCQPCWNEHSTEPLSLMQLASIQLPQIPQFLPALLDSSAPQHTAVCGYGL